jgi:hypothetical protein
VANLSGVYFGCWGSVGHGYHLPDGQTPPYRRGDAKDVTPWGWSIAMTAS